MPYKDCGESYAYQRPLENRGYYLQDIFWPFGSPGCEGHHNGILDFDEEYQPLFIKTKRTTWDFRRLLKKFLESHKDDYYKGKDTEMVKAVGYWKDLHPFVYEVWVRNRICLKCKSQSSYYCKKFERKLCYVQTMVYQCIRR